MVSIFDLFKKKASSRTDDDEPDEEFDDESDELSSDDGELVTDVYDSVCQKCEYGDAIEQLNPYERVLYVTQIVEEEVNNGGFSQFFCNSSGDFAGEMVDAFTQIGALKTAKICKRAISALGGTVPADRDRRQELLDRRTIEKALEKCDDAFYEYEDDLEALNLAYIQKYRAFFD